MNDVKRPFGGLGHIAALYKLSYCIVLYSDRKKVFAEQNIISTAHCHTQVLFPTLHSNRILLFLYQ